MAAKDQATGCFVILTVVFGLAFWPITLAIIFIASVAFAVGYFQNRIYVDEANKWLKSRRSWPCIYTGRYGLLDSIKVEAGKIKLSIKPVKALLPESSVPVDTFAVKITVGSFQHSIRLLLKQNSIEFLQGVSVELSAIESALKCQEQLTWCLDSMNALTKMCDQINRALSLAPGNPLLEPSVPALEAAKARITDESFRITEAKEYSLETLKDLIDYLSVPEELRQPSGITELASTIAIRHDDLRSSFDELLAFNNEYVKLIR